MHRTSDLQMLRPSYIKIHRLIDLQIHRFVDLPIHLSSDLQSNGSRDPHIYLSWNLQIQVSSDC